VSKGTLPRSAATMEHASHTCGMSARCATQAQGLPIPQSGFWQYSHHAIMLSG
jgi:hypothetical protein